MLKENGYVRHQPQPGPLSQAPQALLVSLARHGRGDDPCGRVRGLARTRGRPRAGPDSKCRPPRPVPRRRHYPAPQVDTSDWKSFETFGVGFKYPAEWKVVAKKECEGCEPAGDPRKNPYAKWNILDADGIEIAEFSADSAEDNSGDATYVRTRLETIELDSNMATPTVVLFEHSLANNPTRENNRTAALMVDDAVLAAERDEFPQLAYFRPRRDAAAMLETTNGFAKSLGFKAQDVSLGDAIKMMDTDRVPEHGGADAQRQGGAAGLAASLQGRVPVTDPDRCRLHWIPWVG